MIQVSELIRFHCFPALRPRLWNISRLFVFQAEYFIWSEATSQIWSITRRRERKQILWRHCREHFRIQQTTGASRVRSAWELHSRHFSDNLETQGWFGWKFLYTIYHFIQKYLFPLKFSKKKNISKPSFKVHIFGDELELFLLRKIKNLGKSVLKCLTKSTRN